MAEQSLFLLVKSLGFEVIPKPTVPTLLVVHFLLGAIAAKFKRS